MLTQLPHARDVDEAIKPSYNPRQGFDRDDRDDRDDHGAPRHASRRPAGQDNVQFVCDWMIASCASSAEAPR